MYTKEERRAYSTSRCKELREWVASLKDNPCVDCGIKYAWYVMQWDHKPGVKKVNNVSRLCGSGQSKKVIMREIEKCELVCANCHAERTHRDKNN